MQLEADLTVALVQPVLPRYVGRAARPSQRRERFDDELTRTLRFWPYRKMEACRAHHGGDRYHGGCHIGFPVRGCLNGSSDTTVWISQFLRLRKRYRRVHLGATSGKRGRHEHNDGAEDWRRSVARHAGVVLRWKLGRGRHDG